jgi:outer membrane lipoprotein-sorting protein
MIRLCCLVLVAAGGAAVADDKKPTPAERATAAMDKADKAKSVKMTMKGGDGTTTESWVYHFRRDVGLRTEKLDPKTGEPLFIGVHDFKTEKALTLDAKTKTAQVEPRRVPAMTGSIVPVSVDTANVTAGRDEKTDGRVLRVFEGVRKQLPGGTWVLWVDPKTDLPARLRIDKPGRAGAVATIDLVFSDWNKEFDAKLFSTAVPEGYKPAEPLKK